MLASEGVVFSCTFLMSVRVQSLPCIYQTQTNPLQPSGRYTELLARRGRQHRVAKPHHTLHELGSVPHLEHIGRVDEGVGRHPELATCRKEIVDVLHLADVQPNTTERDPIAHDATHDPPGRNHCGVMQELCARSGSEGDGAKSEGKRKQRRRGELIRDNQTLNHRQMRTCRLPFDRVFILFFCIVRVKLALDRTASEACPLRPAVKTLVARGRLYAYEYRR